MKPTKKIDIPEWLKLKIDKNDQKLTDEEFSKLNYYYKQLTNTKLKKKCQNCVSDAFIVIKIYLKKEQNEGNT